MIAPAIDGFNAATNYPLFSAIFNRRSRRISKGIKKVPAGTLSYESTQAPEPLTPLEEALLIAATGTTGFSMPDRPFQTPSGEAMLGSPNINLFGRAAGSPDNAQATHFFLINDSGTYFLQRVEPNPDETLEFTPESVIGRAERSKKQLKAQRLDFPREFPYYLDSNRFLSNLPGSTILLPVVDTTQQYINGLLYLLTEPDGHRPCFVDDRNFYRPAGVKKWVKRGFLNDNIKIPLGVLGTFRADIEADLLLQNLVLALQAMGLGGWIHASVSQQYLLGHPMYTAPGTGLGCDFQIPRFSLIDFLRWGEFLPKIRANPVKLEGCITCLCPPNYSTMNEAFEALLEMKYGKQGIYGDLAYFKRIFKGDAAERYMKEVPRYTDDAIACAKDVCNYIYDTHGRFPAHVNAIHVPGIWLQAHHIDLQYYDQLFQGGYTATQEEHAKLWH